MMEVRDVFHHAYLLLTCPEDKLKEHAPSILCRIFLRDRAMEQNRDVIKRMYKQHREWPVREEKRLGKGGRGGGHGRKNAAQSANGGSTSGQIARERTQSGNSERKRQRGNETNNVGKNQKQRR